MLGELIGYNIVGYESGFCQIKETPCHLFVPEVDLAHAFIKIDNIKFVTQNVKVNHTLLFRPSHLSWSVRH